MQAGEALPIGSPSNNGQLTRLLKLAFCGSVLPLVGAGSRLLELVRVLTGALVSIFQHG